MRGEKSCISNERIEALEALGFEWRVKPGRVKKTQEGLQNNAENAEQPISSIASQDCNENVTDDAGIEQKAFV